MSTYATFTTDAVSFPLGALLEAVPGATLEVERVVPTDTGAIPYVWIQGAPAEDLRRALDGVEWIDGHHLVDELDDTILVRVDWVEDVDGLFTALDDPALTLLSLTGDDGRLELEVRGEQSTTIRRFQDRCEALGIPLVLTGLRTMVAAGANGSPALTEAQRRALRLAFDRGYFDTPRGCTLEELAGELDITGQAFGARLQRGLRRLVAGAVVAEEP